MNRTEIWEEKQSITAKIKILCKMYPPLIKFSYKGKKISTINRSATEEVYCITVMFIPAPGTVCLY